MSESEVVPVKLKDALQTYYDLSGKASELCRQLSFAALAVVWIFKIEVPKAGFQVPHELLWPAALAIASLAADLSQYVYGTIAWGIFHRINEKRANKNQEAEVYARPAINWPTLAFFWLKIGTVCACYALLLTFLFKTIWR